VGYIDNSLTEIVRGVQRLFLDRKRQFVGDRDSSLTDRDGSWGTEIVP